MAANRRRGRAAARVPATGRTATGRTAAAAQVWVYAGTTFLSAFLLFQVQPLIGKAILPWFGGGSAVWTATMLFFQVALLGGYAYAHFLSNRLALRSQALLHIALLIAAVVVLPIIPKEIWRPTEGGDPTGRILLLLAATVGAPYLLLSSTAPLIQRWFAHDHPGTSPYRLYSLSNTGSLLALLTYPVVFERFLGLREQAWLWSGAYVAFVAVCGTLAWRISRSRVAAEAGETPDLPAGDAPLIEVGGTEEGGTASVTPGNVALWLILPAVASMMLLAATNQLTQDVAAIPLLWVLPLSLYLLTFILCFGDDRAYRPVRDVALLAVSMVVAVFLPGAVTLDLLWQILGYSFVLFMACFTLHGELVRLRPPARHLTAFYLAVAVGGAMGGILVALVAPAVFQAYWEYHVALVATAVLIVVARGIEVARRTRAAGGKMSERQEWMVAAGGVGAVIGVGLLAWTLYGQVQKSGIGVITRGRNFYGAVRVYDHTAADPGLTKREMEHGRILHGFQFLDQAKRALHTGYYGPKSGVGVAMLHHPGRKAGPLRIGIIGLGAGMVASYAEKGDIVSVYEINPMVVDLAERDFTYLSDARARGATVTNYVGDGRLVLEDQVEAGGPDAPQFDVLVLDAFNSDAIPVHLLTREAFALYDRAMKPDGVLAINISNRHVDLSPVVRALAAAEGKEANWVSGKADDGAPGVINSVWMVVSSNRAFLDNPDAKAQFQPWPSTARDPLLWTDDFSNVYDLLHLY